MKSRDQKGGALSPIKSVWQWLWAPRKNPHAVEERENQRRREKRKRGAPTTAKTRAVAEAAPGGAPDLAYVDKSGNVRLTDGGRIVAKASKGSKAAALAAATALYDDRAATLDRLEAQVSLSSASIAELEASLASTKTDLRDAPGLGDIAALDARFAAVEAAMEERTQSQWTAKREIISQLEQLSRTASSGLGSELDALSQQWTNSGSAGSVHDTVLEKRYAAALEAASKQLKRVTDQPELFVAERQLLLDDLIELMASEDRTGMAPRLAALKSAWIEAGGEEDAAMNEQFSNMALAIENDINAHETEVENLRAHIADKATALEVEFDRLAEDAAALSDGYDLKSLSRTVGKLESQAAGSNRDITDKLRRRVDELQWRADREIEKRKSQVIALAGDARKHIDSAQQLPAQIATLKEWRAVEDAAKSGFEQAETALGKLKELGRVAMDDAGRVTSDLRGARKAISEARKSFFESLDESRETNGFKKRALLDRLSHPPLGATTKELDDHVEQVMTDWKATGSAGRDLDQDLWGEFQTLRTGIRGLREEAASAERDDFGARLADAFTRKRELIYSIEDEVRMGQLVLENQKDPKFAKELRRKERRLEELRKDASDIQRKLAKLSKTKAERDEAAAPAETIAVDAAS